MDIEYAESDPDSLDDVERILMDDDHQTCFKTTATTMNQHLNGNWIS